MKKILLTALSTNSAVDHGLMTRCRGYLVLQEENYIVDTLPNPTDPKSVKNYILECSPNLIIFFADKNGGQENYSICLLEGFNHVPKVCVIGYMGGSKLLSDYHAVAFSVWNISGILLKFDPDFKKSLIDVVTDTFEQIEAKEQVEEKR